MPRTKQFKEEEVLQKAMDLFWKKGYHATSMDELVRHLGINRASLYDTFGGKRPLFEKAIDKYIRDNTQIAHGFFSAQESVKEGLSHFFEIVVRESIVDSERKGCFVVNTSTDLMPDDQEMAGILLANKLHFEEVFFQFLKKGQERGEISREKDIAAISKYLVALFNGLKVSAKLQPDEAEMKAIVRVGLSVLHH